MFVVCWRSEGYGSSCCVCLPESQLTYGASVCPENTVTYPAGNGGKNICGFFLKSMRGRAFQWPYILSTIGEHACALYILSAIFLAESTE